MIRSQSKLGQDRAHALIFGLTEPVELATRQIAIDPPEALKSLAPFSRPHHRVNGPLEAFPVDGADARGRHERSPVLELDVDTLLTERRGRHAGQPLCTRDAEHAHSARVDLRGELCEAVDARRHLSAKNCRHRFPPAGERDVVDAPRRHTDGFRYEAGEHLIAATRRSSAPRDRFWLFTERPNEIGQRSKRRRSRNDDRFVFARQPRDRRHLAQRDRRCVRDDGAEHDQARDHDHIVVPAFGADESRKADCACGARNVFDRRGVNNPRALQHLLHDAGGLIPTAPRGRGRDDPEVLVDGLSAGGRRDDADDQRHVHDQQRNDTKHMALSGRSLSHFC